MDAGQKNPHAEKNPHPEKIPTPVVRSGDFSSFSE